MSVLLPLLGATEQWLAQSQLVLLLALLLVACSHFHQPAAAAASVTHIPDSAPCTKNRPLHIPCTQLLFLQFNQPCGHCCYSTYILLLLTILLLSLYHLTGICHPPCCSGGILCAWSSLPLIAGSLIACSKHTAAAAPREYLPDYTHIQPGATLPAYKRSPYSPAWLLCVFYARDLPLACIYLHQELLQLPSP